MMPEKKNIILKNERKRKEPPCSNLIQGESKKLRLNNWVAITDENENDYYSEGSYEESDSGNEEDNHFTVQ